MNSMASRTIKKLAAILLMTSLMADASQRFEICPKWFGDISHCRNYLSGKSESPDVCCTLFKLDLYAQPKCTCLFDSDGRLSTAGFSGNLTEVFAIAEGCDLHVRPVDECYAADAPWPDHYDADADISPPDFDSAASFSKPASIPIIFAIATILKAYLV